MLTNIFLAETKKMAKKNNRFFIWVLEFYWVLWIQSQQIDPTQNVFLV